MGVLRSNQTTLFLQYCDLGQIDNILTLNIEEHRSEVDYGLHLASKYGYIKVVEYLLKNHGNPGYRSSGYRSCIHVAAESDHFEIVKLLLEHGADPTRRTEYEYNAVQYATGRSLRLLVELGVPLKLPVKDLIECRVYTGPPSSVKIEPIGYYFIPIIGASQAQTDDALFKLEEYIKSKRRYSEYLTVLLNQKFVGPEVESYLVGVHEDKTRIFTRSGELT